nr:MAG TPA: hypothetical protein [Crassvirales sp.]
MFSKCSIITLIRLLIPLIKLTNITDCNITVSH